MGHAREGDGQFSGLHGIEADRSGRVYVADRGNQRIQVFDADGKHLDTWPNIRFPNHILVTADQQQVWVSDGTNARILKYDTNGKLQVLVGCLRHAAWHLLGNAPVLGRLRWKPVRRGQFWRAHPKIPSATGRGSFKIGRFTSCAYEVVRAFRLAGGDVMKNRRTALIGLTAATGLALAMTAMVGQGQNVNSGQVFAEPPVPPRGAAQNLATKITASFTVAAVGDVMVKRAGAEMADPAFQGAFQIIRDADVGFGNMEGNLSDLEHFNGPLRGMMGDKDVAPALKKIGFDVMNRANNHIFDSDRESMFSTMAELDAAGIIHAGTGKNLEDARAPAFLDTPKGRVSLVAMHTPNQAGNPSGASVLERQRRRTSGVECAELHDVLPRHRRTARGHQSDSARGVYAAGWNDQRDEAARRSVGTEGSGPAVWHLVQDRHTRHAQLRNGQR